MVMKIKTWKKIIKTVKRRITFILLSYTLCPALMNTGITRSYLHKPSHKVNNVKAHKGSY